MCLSKKQFLACPALTRNKRMPQYRLNSKHRVRSANSVHNCTFLRIRVIDSKAQSIHCEIVKTPLYFASS